MSRNGPFLRPADGEITSKAGPRPGVGAFNTHFGVDIGALLGWACRSMYRGTVVSVVHFARDDWRVNIRHEGFIARYLHLRSVSVKVGDRITGDSPAARQFGTTGTAGPPPFGGPHVHVEIHPGSTWAGSRTASISRINNLLLGTPVDGSSNPPGGGSRPAASTPTPTGGLTVSIASSINSTVRAARDALAKLIREELPKIIWQSYRDGQNAGRDSSRSKSFQVSLAAERAESANVFAKAAARDAAAALEAIKELAASKDKSREEQIKAVEAAAARGAARVNAMDVAELIDVDTQIRVKDSDDGEA